MSPNWVNQNDGEYLYSLVRFEPNGGRSVSVSDGFNQLFIDFFLSFILACAVFHQLRALILPHRAPIMTLLILLLFKVQIMSGWNHFGLCFGLCACTLVVADNFFHLYCCGCCLVSFSFHFDDGRKLRKGKSPYGAASQAH